MGKSDTASVYSGRSSLRSNVTASTNCHMPGKRKSLANKALIYLAGGNPMRHSHLRKDEMEDSTGHKKIAWYFVDYAGCTYYEAFEYEDNESQYSSKSRKSKSKHRRHRSSSRESFSKPRSRRDPDEGASMYSSSDSDEESEPDYDNEVPQFMPPPQHFPGHHQFPPQGPPPGFGPQMHPGFGGMPPPPPPPPPQEAGGTPDFFVIK